jgi:hypothetical protein
MRWVPIAGRFQGLEGLRPDFRVGDSTPPHGDAAWTTASRKNHNLNHRPASPASAPYYIRKPGPRYNSPHAATLHGHG